MIADILALIGFWTFIASLVVVPVGMLIAFGAGRMNERKADHIGQVHFPHAWRDGK